MNKSTDEVDKWLAIRKKAARKIDPETAEVMWEFGYDFDPYGVNPELPEEFQVVSRQYFARAPGSDIWVCFVDLPCAAARALWEKHKGQLAFTVFLKPGANLDSEANQITEGGGL